MPCFMSCLGHSGGGWMRINTTTTVLLGTVHAHLLRYVSIHQANTLTWWSVWSQHNRTSSLCDPEGWFININKHRMKRKISPLEDISTSLNPLFTLIMLLTVNKDMGATVWAFLPTSSARRQRTMCCWDSVVFYCCRNWRCTFDIISSVWVGGGLWWFVTKSTAMQLTRLQICRARLTFLWSLKMHSLRTIGWHRNKQQKHRCINNAVTKLPACLNTHILVLFPFRFRRKEKNACVIWFFTHNTHKNT